MGEIPAKIITSGNREAAKAHIGDGRRIMSMLERFMEFQGLEQGVLRRQISPGCFVECVKQFGLRTINIHVDPGWGGRSRRKEIECFANTTCALGYIIEVAGIAVNQDDGYLQEPVCHTCIAPSTYPDGYYCTKGIRYSVVVCDGKGEYLLFEGVPSADFTPRCPEEQVIVMFNRTTDLPAALIDRANVNPWAKRPFTRALPKSGVECISILPFQVEMPKYREIERR